MRICFECDKEPIANEIICSNCGGCFEEITSTVGDKVKRSRVGLGLSLREVAKLIGVSAQTIAKVERASFSMSESKVVVLAEALNLDPDQLLLDFGRCPSDAVPQTIEEVEAVRSIRSSGSSMSW